MKILISLFIAFILNFLFFNLILLNAQELSKNSMKIIDFDGDDNFNEFDFTKGQSSDTQVDFRTRLNKSDAVFILQGNGSRKIEWNLQPDQYGYWGINLLKANRGYDASQVKTLQFGVIGIRGGERFTIEIKDKKGKSQTVPSINYFQIINTWQTVSIPFEDFRNIDITQLATLSLVFDEKNSGRNGVIYIDSFSFIQRGNTIAQERRTAPLKIIDFDGGGDFYEVEFAGPESNNWARTKVGFQTRLNNSDSKFIMEGNASRYFEWNDLQRGQYGAWGMDIRRGKNGYDATQANALQFGVIGATGGERFKIEIKDVTGRKLAVPSIKYFRVTNEWKTVTIPLSDFDKDRIGINQLEAITLVFDKTTSRQKGSIYVDNFTFTQRGENVAPITIINFDGIANCVPFAFAGPDSIRRLLNPVDYEISYMESDGRFIRSPGSTSRYLRWKLDMSQWCGWAVVVGDTERPFNANQIKCLTFWVIGARGNETFNIEIKDITEQRRVYSSTDFISVGTVWKKICIPFDKSLTDAINHQQLEAIALVFTGSDSDWGTIYVDDFQFEFANCK